VTELILGTTGLNLAFVAVGYALLAPVLRGSSATAWLSYAGVALLTGIGVVLVALCAVAVAGAKVGPTAFAVVAIVLSATGLVAAWRVPARLRALVAARDAPRQAETGRLAEAVATAAATLVGALLVIALIGAFRSTPWLSDVWTFWLPKGIALDKVGLDPRLWEGTSGRLTFDVPDYPFLWSILTNLDIRFVGRVDMRAVNVQEAYLLIGFAGSVARLLWGTLRPWILWGGVLFSLALPELVRQAQGGAADVPLALYVTAALVAAVVWLLQRTPLALALAGVFSAAAFSTKSESYPDIALWLVLLTVVCWRFTPRRVAAVWAAVALGAVTSLPWIIWKAIHGVQNQVRLNDLFSPTYLAHHGGTLHESNAFITLHFRNVHEWTIVFPLFAAVGIVGALLEREPRRRVLWLAAPAYVVLSWAMLVWIFWADRNAAFRLANSAYRLVDVFAVTSALGTVFGVEFILRRRQRQRA
jgi:hypothetical protein